MDFTAKSGKRVELKGLPVLATRGPDKPFIERLGFDAQGRPVALVSNIYANRKLQKDQSGKTTEKDNSADKGDRDDKGNKGEQERSGS